MRFTPGWSVAYNFIPVLHWFKPYQVMKEIWRISHKNIPYAHSMVRWWWFLNILTITVGMFSNPKILTEKSFIDGLFSTEIVTQTIFYNSLTLFSGIVQLELIQQIGEAYFRYYVEPTKSEEDIDAELHTM
jgi:hypothetical protein